MLGGGKLWESIAIFFSLREKVEHVAWSIKDQQSKIERLNERVIRLETLLELNLARQGVRVLNPRHVQLDSWSDNTE